MLQLEALRVHVHRSLRVDPDVQPSAHGVRAHIHVRQPHLVAAAMVVAPRLRSRVTAADFERGQVERAGVEAVELGSVHKAMARVQSASRSRREQFH